MTRMRSAILGTILILLVVNVLGSLFPATAEFDQADRLDNSSPGDLSSEVWLPIQPKTIAATEPAQSGTIQASLSATHHTTSYDSRVGETIKFDLALLYLHHERESTAQDERTLTIEIAGLTAGREILIEARSRHVDISTGAQHSASISFVSPDRACTSDDPCQVDWTFDAHELASDLYYLLIEDASGNLLWSNPHPERPDFAMLDTWATRIDGYQVRITYATLFPFAKGPEDLENRLSPAEVIGFVEREFVPMVIESWETQVHDWGFGEPLHPDWDPDKVVEIFITAYPFALFDGTGTNTVFVKEGRPYPQRRIWWMSSNGSFQRYDTLANGCKVIFAHEFFHLMQWNVLLNAGRPTDHWLNTFVEAQGRLAQAVQYPQLELGREHLVMESSNFVQRSANRFLTERLNASYSEMESARYHRYDLALYWRYLYEQSGGMDVVRVALEQMAANYDADVVGAIGNVMDKTFERVGGPFQSFEQSLVGFARATYALRLEAGRCAEASLSGCGGFFYDPQHLYANPALEARVYHRGGTRTHSGAIPASFGMDFVDIGLAPALFSQPLTVTVQVSSDIAKFNVEIWKLSAAGASLQAVTAQPEAVPETRKGLHAYTISALDLADYDRLALIITRLDADEALDPEGSYSVTLSTPVEVLDDGDAGDLVSAEAGSVAQ